MSSNKDRNISGYPNLGDFQIFRAEVINNNDEKQKSRVQCRMIGHETDLINMPDEDMQWYSLMTPETAHRGMGYNPRYVPGDQVYCLQFGDERIILGAVRKEDPYEGEEADVNPWILDGSSSPKSPPDESSDKNKGWQQGLRSETIKTREDKTEYSRQSKRNRQESKKIQGESKAKNIYNRNKNRFGDNLSIGKDIPFDNSKNPMKFIQNRIQNNGAVVPEMLSMVETLRTKSETANPGAIPAVGAQNYINFIKNLTKYFDRLKTEDQKKKDEQDEELQNEKEKDEEDIAAAEAELFEEEQGNG